MSTQFSDSPHYQTACLHSSVTVHTTKLQVYTVQWQSTLPKVTKIRISGLELWQVGKDCEGNRLTRATVRSHVSQHYKQTPSVSNECNKLHTSAVSCQDLTTAQTHIRHIQRGYPTSADTPLHQTDKTKFVRSTSTAADACRNVRLAIAVPQLRLTSTDTMTSYTFVQFTTTFLFALLHIMREREPQQVHTWSPFKFLAFTIFGMPQRPRGEEGSSRGK